VEVKVPDPENMEALDPGNIPLNDKEEPVEYVKNIRKITITQ
jgi:hypothetical protein